MRILPPCCLAACCLLRAARCLLRTADPPRSASPSESPVTRMHRAPNACRCQLSSFASGSFFLGSLEYRVVGNCGVGAGQPTPLPRWPGAVGGWLPAAGMGSRWEQDLGGHRDPCRIGAPPRGVSRHSPATPTPWQPLRLPPGWTARSPTPRSGRRRCGRVPPRPPRWAVCAPSDRKARVPAREGTARLRHDALTAHNGVACG